MEEKQWERITPDLSRIRIPEGYIYKALGNGIALVFVPLSMEEHFKKMKFKLETR